jgi:hypothetical protein
MLLQQKKKKRLKEKTSTGKPPNKQLKHQPIKSTYYVCLSRKIKTYASEQTRWHLLLFMQAIVHGTRMATIKQPTYIANQKSIKIRKAEQDSKFSKHRN